MRHLPGRTVMADVMQQFMAREGLGDKSARTALHGAHDILRMVVFAQHHN